MAGQNWRKFAIVSLYVVWYQGGESLNFCAMASTKIRENSLLSLRSVAHRKKRPRRFLLLLFVNSVCLCNGVVFLGFVLFARILLVLVVVPSVIDVTFANSILVAD